MYVHGKHASHLGNSDACLNVFRLFAMKISEEVFMVRSAKVCIYRANGPFMLNM